MLEMLDQTFSASKTQVRSSNNKIKSQLNKLQVKHSHLKQKFNQGQASNNPGDKGQYPMTINGVSQIFSAGEKNGVNQLDRN